MQFSSSLKLNHIFRRLYRKGQSAANGYLVLYCRKNGSRWRLTPKGFMLSNQVILTLLEAQQRSKPLAQRR